MTNELTLLYVEDDELVRENFTEIFTRYFKNVITADNGKTALEIYKNNDINVAILDISIPAINGLHLASIIREDNKDIEIIILSEYSDKEKLLQAVNLQLFYYLIKPVKIEALSKTLNDVINKLSNNVNINLNFGYIWNTETNILSYKNKNIKTTKNEIKLIKYLYENSNTYKDSCDIARNIFDSQEEVSCNNIVQLISRFRKKMLDSYNKEDFFIDNIYGLGYKLLT